MYKIPLLGHIKRLHMSLRCCGFNQKSCKEEGFTMGYGELTQDKKKTYILT